MQAENRTGHRRVPLVVALVSVLVVCVGGFVAWRVNADNGSHGDDALVGVGAPADGIVTSYSIRYRTVFADAELDELVEVSRPFRSRVDSASSVQISDVGVLATSSDGESWLRIGVPISVATSDLRPLPALAAVVAEGGALALGESEVQGRSCRRYELGGPVASGAFTPIDAVPGESAEVCIDELGLVLREVWTIDDVVVRTREAVEISFETIGSARFDVPSDAQELSYDDGGGSVRTISPDADPGFVEYWVPSSTPDGFEFVDRWAVAPPMIDARPDDGMPRISDIALVTDAWQRGPDLLILDQGAGKTGIEPPWDADDPSTEVDLGSLGVGHVVADLQMSEVRITRPEGGFVRVAGTIPPDELIAFARALCPG